MLNIKNNIGSLPEGTYVWKKYTITQNKIYEAENFTASIIQHSGSDGNWSELKFTFNVTPPSFDLFPLYEFFDGFNICKNGVAYFNFVNDNSKLVCKDASTGNTLSTITLYDSSGNDVVLKFSNYSLPIHSPETYTLVYSGKKVKYGDVHTFEDFVVSNNPTAYPDGGEQGGYWYEKVSEITPEIFGGTKVAVDEITFSKTGAYRQAINHSLGERPKFVLLSRKNLYSELPSFVNTITTGVAHNPSASGSATLKIYVNDGTTNFALNYNVVMLLYETSIMINDKSGFYLQGTYFLITVV